ncbi:hypothetical protein ACFQX7_24850 [Luedemannella flava]
MTITNNDDLWLTAVLRPAGVLSASAVERLAEEMTSVARTANIVVVNLVAAQVTDVEALAAALKGPGRCSPRPTSACSWSAQTRSCWPRWTGRAARSPRSRPSRPRTPISRWSPDAGNLRAVLGLDPPETGQPAAHAPPDEWWRRTGRRAPVSSGLA